MNPERPRMRNYAGMAMLLTGLIVYVFAAAALLGQTADWPLAIQMLLYGIAGILWVWPARAILRWMARDAK